MRRLQIEPGAYFIGAAGLILLPLRFALALAAAAAVHEFFHYLAAKIIGNQVYAMKISEKGCLLDMEPMSRNQELVCAAAGPVGSLLLLALIHRLPLLALCGAVQGLYNLLPLYPMDGGRILYCTAAYLFGEINAARILKWSGITVSLLLLMAGSYLAIRMKWGILPVIVFASWWLSTRKAKNSLQTGETRGTIELPFSKR